MSLMEHVRRFARVAPARGSTALRRRWRIMGAGSADCVSFLSVLVASQALYSGVGVDQIHQLTAIDKWFLHKLRRITELEQHLGQYNR